MLPEQNQELYDKAVALHSEVYKKPQWNKKVYEKKTGYMLQHLFGKEVWKIKDLNNEQLQRLIDTANNKKFRDGRKNEDKKHD